MMMHPGAAAGRQRGGGGLPPQQQQHAPQQQSAGIGKEYFSGAPASKYMTAFMIVFYIVLNAQQSLHAIAFDSSSLSSSSSNYYRYWTSQCTTFGTSGELLIGTSFLSMLMQKYERELSTRKFLVLSMFVVVSTMSLEYIIVQTAVLLTPWRYTGPYPLIGALFALFHTYTPRLYPRFFGIGGLHFSEKSLYYLWFLYVMGAGGWHTALPTMLGFGVTLLFYIPLLQYKLDFPQWIVQLLQPILQPFVDTTAASQSSSLLLVVVGPNMAMTMNGRNHHHHPPFVPPAARAAPPAPAPAPVEPNPDAIAQLTAMGFDRTQVMEALRQTNNQVEQAADRLLTQPQQPQPQQQS